MSAAICTHCGGTGIPAPRYCAECSGDMVLPGDVPQFVEALALLREVVDEDGYMAVTPAIRAFLVRHGWQG